MTNPEDSRLTKGPHAGDIPTHQGGEVGGFNFNLQANPLHKIAKQEGWDAGAASDDLDVDNPNIPNSPAESRDPRFPSPVDDVEADVEAKKPKAKMSLGKRILAVVGIGTVVGGGIGVGVAVSNSSEDTSSPAGLGETNTIPTPTTAIEADATNTVITTAEVTPAATEPVISGDHGGSTAEVTTPAPTTAIETAPVTGEGMSEAEVARLTAMNSGEFLANTTYGQRVEYGAIKVAERQDKTLEQANTWLAYYDSPLITLPVAASPNNTGTEIVKKSWFKYATITNTLNIDVDGVINKDAYTNSIPEMTKLTSSFAMEGNSVYTNTLSKLDLNTSLLVNTGKVTSETELAVATSGNPVKKVQYTLDGEVPSGKQFVEETYEFVAFNPANPNEGEWVVVFSQAYNAPLAPLPIVNAN